MTTGTPLLRYLCPEQLRKAVHTVLRKGPFVCPQGFRREHCREEEAGGDMGGALEELGRS